MHAIKQPKTVVQPPPITESQYQELKSDKQLKVCGHKEDLSDVSWDVHEIVYWGFILTVWLYFTAYIVYWLASGGTI